MARRRSWVVGTLVCWHIVATILLGGLRFTAQPLATSFAHKSELSTTSQVSAPNVVERSHSPRIQTPTVRPTVPLAMLWALPVVAWNGWAELPKARASRDRSSSQSVLFSTALWPRGPPAVS